MSEQEAIAKTLQHYIEGARTGSSAEMKRAFHEDATIFGYEGDGLFAGPIQRLFDWNEHNGAARHLKANIVNIDVAGTIATARLELDNWTGTNFTDLFTLLKVDGQWKIMNKVFHVRPARAGGPNREGAESVGRS